MWREGRKITRREQRLNGDRVDDLKKRWYDGEENDIRVPVRENISYNVYRIDNKVHRPNALKVMTEILYRVEQTLYLFYYMDLYRSTIFSFFFLSPFLVHFLLSNRCAVGQNVVFIFYIQLPSKLQ